jgi:hypothetical protein
MKINFFKKENKFKKENFRLNFNFYWELAIFITFILMLVSLSFGYYVFKQINQEPDLQTLQGSEQYPKINKDRIDKVLLYFSEKENKSNTILNSGVPVVDPSL